MTSLERLPLVRSIVWKNTGFANLRKIRYLIEDYEPRFDPTVVPLVSPSSAMPDSKPAVTTTPLPNSPLSAAFSERKYYTAADYHALYLSGEITPLAVAQAILPLIRRDLSPPGEHSVAWFDTNVEMVFAAAKASTLRYKEKRPLGVLDGVPTGVKDDYDLVGYKTTLGSLNDYTNKVVAPEDITMWPVRKLEESGAVILGKLSMHEFGLGMLSSSTWDLVRMYIGGSELISTC